MIYFFQFNSWYFCRKDDIFSIVWEIDNQDWVLSDYFFLIQHVISLLDGTDNFTDWHLQSIHLIHFIFIMSFKLPWVIQNKMEQIEKNTPKMALRTRKTINQEWNNTTSTPDLQENNEKSLIDTIRKIVKEEFDEHETKMSEMISNNLQNTNDRLEKYLWTNQKFWFYSRPIRIRNKQY